MTSRAYIVTGGAGALGRAVVQRLLRDGHRVAVLYRRETEWSSLRSAVGVSDRLWGEASDVSDIHAAELFVTHAVAWLGGLEGVVALAGGWAGSPSFDVAPPQEWDDMMRVNLETARATCRAALPHLLEDGGSVVMVSSRLVTTGGAGSAAYTVSKAAVEALTRVLALENENRGVRFNAVAPGIIDTPANRRSMPKADPSRWTPPEKIADVIAFLLSPDSAPVTGAVIPVHGRS